MIWIKDKNTLDSPGWIINSGMVTSSFYKIPVVSLLGFILFMGFFGYYKMVLEAFFIIVDGFRK